jgi:aconitate decarboxylase
MTGLTQALAEFVAAPPFSHPPEALLRTIRNGFVDTCATMIAGRAEPVVRIVQGRVAARRVAPIGRTGESSILLSAMRAASTDAALINGTAAHALDYDDVALGGHPSTVLVPALMAEGEAMGASGADILRAYLVGYEVWAELISRDADAHHLKGWHPTAVFGTVGVAAAVSALRRVPVEVARNALAIAASMAGGLAANFGSMTKPFHAGRAASSGIEAVHLAQAGMTGTADAIEHRAGFLAAISHKGNVDLASPMAQSGRELRMQEAGLNIKKYPVCYAVHRVIDGMLDLANQSNVHSADVESIHAQVGVTQAAMLRNHAPQTALEAKFSLEFALASALVAREVGLSQLTDSFVQRREVQATMARVHATTVDTVCPIEPFLALTDRVTLKMKNGAELDTGEIRFARGSAKLPLSDGDLRRKFLDCAASAPDLGAENLYEQLMALQALSDVRGLTANHR